MNNVVSVIVGSHIRVSVPPQNWKNSLWKSLGEPSSSLSSEEYFLLCKPFDRVLLEAPTRDTWSFEAELLDGCPDFNNYHVVYFANNSGSGTEITRAIGTWGKFENGKLFLSIAGIVKPY